MISQDVGAGRTPQETDGLRTIAEPGRRRGSQPADWEQTRCPPHARSPDRARERHAGNWAISPAVGNQTSSPIKRTLTGASSPVERLWYPSESWQGTGGSLTAYCLKDNARELDAMDDDDRHRLIVQRVASLHPGVPAAAEPLAVRSVSWSQVPDIEGAWVNWPSYPDPAFLRLQQGWDRIQFAGDWLSPLTAWMAGAFSSAGAALLNIIDSASERQ
ncbi:FAD-dependent oxidoreductase [Streptomyces sp. NPDC001523]|uniref:FAD-dependent oxidoreductase n=1 Tax=Streptomyces sp. NPDC001523 TaxID=3154383 RepID=UPI00333288FF